MNKQNQINKNKATRRAKPKVIRPKKKKNIKAVTPKTLLAAKPAVKSVVLSNNHGNTYHAQMYKHNKKINRMGDSVAWAKNSMQASMFEEYIATMEDPFTYGPIRLGFGCMVPTNCATVYVRGTTTVNADGSVGFYFVPANSTAGGTGFRGGLYINNAGAAVATWFPVTWANAGAVQLLGDEARIVSGGCRIVPLQAATSAPGIIYAGSISSAANSQLGSLTANTISTNPFVEWAVATSGAEVLCRPCDLDALSFNTTQQFGYGDNDLTALSCSIIACKGMPAGATIAYEAVLNLEILPDQNFASTNYVGEEKTALLDGLSDFIPSVDALWSAARHILHNPVILEVATAIGATGISSLASKYSNKPYHKRGLKKILKAPQHAAYTDNCDFFKVSTPQIELITDSDEEKEKFVDLSESTVLARALSKMVRV